MINYLLTESLKKQLMIIYYCRPQVKYLSNAPRLLSTKSAEEESSFPTFTFVIPEQQSNRFLTTTTEDFSSDDSAPLGQPTEDAFLRRRRHNVAIWSMFFWELLVEAQEVAEASPHREGLVAEHRHRGLKRRFGKSRGDVTEAAKSVFTGRGPSS